MIGGRQPTVLHMLCVGEEGRYGSDDDRPQPLLSVTVDFVLLSRVDRFVPIKVKLFKIVPMCLEYLVLIWFYWEGGCPHGRAL